MSGDINPKRERHWSSPYHSVQGHDCLNMHENSHLTYFAKLTDFKKPQVIVFIKFHGSYVLYRSSKCDIGCD